MYLKIPSVAPNGRDYIIPVQVRKVGQKGPVMYYSKKLGMVAMKSAKYMRKVVCFVRIPGQNHEKAVVCRGRAVK